jgi:electron transport complex protein RnfG
MFRAMVGIGLLCGALIVTVYRATGPRIERNKAEALQRAIFMVLPEARSSVTFVYDEAAGFRAPEEDGSKLPRVHAGYDEQQRLVGLAVEAGGMGYQDVIRLLYGYSFSREAIVGIRVLESKETPGLGDKIETDPGFLRNFEKLDVTLAADGAQLAHAIEAVKQGKKEHPWQVDGITGATISSQAIADILDRSATLWVPRIRRHLDDFRRTD